VTDEEIAKLEIIDKLPDYFQPQRGEPVPEGIIGATIVRFGTISANGQSVDGGGLVIDYLPSGGEQGLRRVVLGFNEVCMWSTCPVMLSSWDVHERPVPANLDSREQGFS